MTYADLKRMLDESVMRPDLAQWHKEWVRRSMRRIQDAHEWEAISDVVSADITIDASSQSAPLPANFRSFTSEPSPIHVRSSSSREDSLFPCVLISRQQALSFKSATFYPPSSANLRAPAQGVPVYVTNDGSGRRFLNLTAQANEPLVFVVEYYAYVPEMVADEDTNEFLLQYPELVENAVKSAAFKHINDLAMVAASEKLFDTALREAKSADFQKANKGRTLRMGGGGR